MLLNKNEYKKFSFGLNTRKMNWYGHVRRSNDERLPQKNLEFFPTGRRRKGKPRISWMQEVKLEGDKRELTTWNGSTGKNGEAK